MESINQRPSCLINMRGILSFSNQIENFPIWMSGTNFVLIGFNMNTATRTQAKCMSAAAAEPQRCQIHSIP
jgi:hypothetical protein